MKLCLVIYEKKLEALLRNIDPNMLTEVRLDFSNFKDQEIAIIFRHSKNLIATFRENNRTTHAQRIQSLKVLQKKTKRNYWNWQKNTIVKQLFHTIII